MKHYDEKQMQENILYLEALSEQYPNIQSAAAEMINLHAILDLPKGTEHSRRARGIQTYSQQRIGFNQRKD